MRTKIKSRTFCNLRMTSTSLNKGKDFYLFYYKHCTKNNASMHVSCASGVTLEWYCPNLFTVPSASVCHVLLLGNILVCVVFHSKWMTCSQLSRHIKQQAVVEFLTNVNDILIQIRQRLLAFYGEDTVDLSTVYC